MQVQVRLGELCAWLCAWEARVVGWHAMAARSNAARRHPAASGALAYQQTTTGLLCVRARGASVAVGLPVPPAILSEGPCVYQLCGTFVTLAD